MNSSCYSRPTDTIIQKVVRLQFDFSPRQQMLKVNLQYMASTREINFSRAMKDISGYGFPIDHSQIFYWDYNKKMFTFIGNYPFKHDCFIKYEHFQEKVIHLRLRRHGGAPEPRREQMDIEETRIRKNEKRVKQRSIQEVIDKVRLWRGLYEATDSYKKKIHTLESAAREVGIAKKTLDDYFLHLRLAEKYRFDFEANRYAKIGVLRTFVKEHQKNVKIQAEVPTPEQSFIAPTPAASVKMENESSAGNSSDEQSQAYLFHHDDSISD